MKSQLLPVLISIFKEHFLLCPFAFPTAFRERYLTLTSQVKRSSGFPKCVASSCWLHSYWDRVPRSHAQSCWVRFLVMSRICSLFNVSQVASSPQPGLFLLLYSPLIRSLLKAEYGSKSLSRFFRAFRGLVCYFWGHEWVWSFIFTVTRGHESDWETWDSGRQELPKSLVRPAECLPGWHCPFH